MDITLNYQQICSNEHVLTLQFDLSLIVKTRATYLMFPVNQRIKKCENEIRPLYGTLSWEVDSLAPPQGSTGSTYKSCSCATK